MDIQKILNRFFWIAFAAFLLASIPHVAYFFRSFEPLDGWWYWFVAYAIALSIDVTVFLLSLTVASLRQKHVNGWVVSSVWLFILLLAGLSWFVNWEYATQFTSGMLAKPEMNGFVHFINPMIASCFQALAIAYTWISDKIAQTALPVLEVGMVENVQDAVCLQENEDSTICELVEQKQLSPREQIVLLLTEGKRCTEIAVITGKSKSYVSQISKQVGKGIGQ